MRSVRVFIGTPPILQWMQNDAALKQRLLGAEPVGRAGKPEEIGNAVAWLFSDGASFVTGAAIPVDGGLTAQ